MPETMTIMPTDDALLAAWKQRVTAAGEELVDRYFPILYRFFKNKARSADDVDDLVQQTFTGLLERVDRLQAVSFRAYVLGVAHHILCAYYKARHRSDQRFDLGSVSAEDLGPGALSQLCEQEDERMLLVSLRRVSLEDQMLLEMFYWEHMTGPEIAEVLQIPLGTLRGRLRAARQRLQAAMNERVLTRELEGTLVGLRTWASGVRKQRG